MAFATPLDDLYALDLLLNSLFVIDMALNFVTALVIPKGHRKGQLETRHSSIAFSYMKGWFWIDFVATVPLDLIMQFVSGSSGGTSFNKLVRLLRGFKLIRVMRMSRIMGRLSSALHLNPVVIRLGKLFAIIMFLWHWLGCFYWMFSAIEGFGFSTWTPPLQVGEQPFGTQYAQAFFWAVNATLGVGRDIL